MANLFALTSDPARRILRFPLDAAVQQEINSIFSQQFFDFQDGCDEEIAFDGNYKPDPNELLVISDFDDIDGIMDAINTPLNIQEVQGNNIDFESIKAIFTSAADSAGNKVALIQIFEKKRVLSSNGISLFHSGNVFKKISGAGLTLDTKLVATLSSSNLKFRSFSLLRRIFDLSAHYKEATDADIQNFATMKCLHVPNIAKLEAAADSWVRRKIWLIYNSELLDKVSLQDIRAIAMEFSIPIALHSDPNGEEKILIPEEKKELKSLLRFLDEDYYKSPLLQNLYFTNSKRAISSNS